MMNTLNIIGRIVRDPEYKELEDGKKVSNITIAVQRAYKNADGEYETDFMDITLWNGIASNVSEYCKKGDLIGVRGRLATRKDKDNNMLEIVAEKVTFLAASKNLNETIETDKDTIGI